MRRCLLASIGAALLLAGVPGVHPALAQQRSAPRPFENLSLSLAAVANVGRGDFHDLWRPSAGGELAAGAPFYLGAVELGVNRMSFDGRDAAPVPAPDFSAWFVFLGWGGDIGLVPGLRWEPGFRLGSYSMRFDGPGIPDHRRTESELGIEAVSKVAWRFAPAWDLLLTGSYRTVLTEPEIRHGYAAAGVRRTFGAPRWLRDFLD